MKKEISIKGKTYTMAHSVRARIIFEAIFENKRMWSLATLTDQYAYMFACIQAGTADSQLKYDELLDAIDEDPSLFKEFSEFIMAAVAKEQALMTSSKSEGKN